MVLFHFFFQSGPKTLNSIQPVNFISDFWLRIEDIFPHTPPSSLKSLSGSSTVGQPFFFPRRCCCFFFGAQKKQPTKVAFFFQQSWRFQDLKIFSGLEVYPFYKFYKTTFFGGERNCDRYFKLKFRTYEVGVWTRTYDTIIAEIMLRGPKNQAFGRL